MKTRFSATGLGLIVALLTGLVGSPISARGEGHDKPLRLYASAPFAPIGAVSVDSVIGGSVAIDGRLVQGEGTIWGGELIRVAPDRTAQVALDSIGEIKLSHGAEARFSTARCTEGDAGYLVLVASIVEGKVEVRLNSEAGAFIQTATSVFTASRGARFNIRVGQGRDSLASTVGVVRTQDQPPPQDVNIRLVDDLGRPVASGSQFSVRARSTRQVQVQVTDKNDKPIPDLPVLFSLGNPCLGTLGLGALAGMSLMQKTDKKGIAAVPLVSGAARCAATILAKVEGTNASVSIQASVQPKAQFWNTQNTLLVTAAAAAAGIGAYVAVANSGGGGEKITPVPPPTLKP